MLEFRTGGGFAMGRLLIGLLQRMFIRRLELAGVAFADPKKYVQDKVYSYLRQRIGTSDLVFLLVAIMYSVVIVLELLYAISDFGSYLITRLGEWMHHVATLWPLLTISLHFGVGPLLIWAISIALGVAGVSIWAFRFVKRLLPYSHPQPTGHLVWIVLLGGILCHVGSFLLVTLR